MRLAPRLLPRGFLFAARREMFRGARLMLQCFFESALLPDIEGDGDGKGEEGKCSEACGKPQEGFQLGLLAVHLMLLGGSWGRR